MFFFDLLIITCLELHEGEDICFGVNYPFKL